MKAITISAVLILAAATASANVWQYEDIYVTTSEWIIHTPMVLENGETAHVAFCELNLSSNSSLMYAHQTASGWDLTAVLESSTSDELARNLSLTLTDDGFPCIAYTFNKSSGELDYTFWNGSEWEYSVVTGGNYVGDVSLSLKSGSGNPAIAYSTGYGMGDHDVMYAEFDGSWQVSCVDTTGDRGLSVDMALASDNTPHISYYDINTADLMYACRDSDQWQTSTLVSAGSMGMNNSIAMDSNDYPHIVYQDFLSSELEYIHYNGSEWIQETVDQEGSLGTYCNSIALDSYGNPHISYYDLNGSQLKYAFFNGTSWEITVIDTGDEAGQSSSLTLDGYNRPHIIYTVAGSSEKMVRYAHFAPLGIEDGELQGQIFLSVTPNPSTGNATVNFTLPQAGRATVELYDLSGRKILELADANFSAGTSSISATDLSTGIYLCRLTAGGLTATEKLVVIR